jgi:hypothetical protein
MYRMYLLDLRNTDFRDDTRLRLAKLERENYGRDPETGLHPMEKPWSKGRLPERRV